jgi:hypothetical protein
MLPRMAPSQIRLLICWQANLLELRVVSLFERGLKGCLKVRISPLWAIAGVGFCYKPNLRTSNLKLSFNVSSISRTASKKKACSAGEFRTGLLIAWITTCIHCPLWMRPLHLPGWDWTLPYTNDCTVSAWMGLEADLSGIYQASIWLATVSVNKCGGLDLSAWNTAASGVW